MVVLIRCHGRVCVCDDATGGWLGPTLIGITVDIYDQVTPCVIRILTTTRQLIKSRSSNEDTSHGIYVHPQLKNNRPTWVSNPRPRD